MPLDVLPVVHAGPFELGVVEFEAERFDQVQSRFGRGAKAGDVAGVGRDFRFEEDDVHQETSWAAARSQKTCVLPWFCRQVAGKRAFTGSFSMRRSGWIFEGPLTRTT